MEIPETRFREHSAEHELEAANLGSTPRADVVQGPIQRQLEEQ
jgi:hypothetical protein